MRNTQGKHVIPIPYMQVEQNKLKKIIQKGKKLFSKQRRFIGEETIIQPHFTRGTITIDENVYRDIITYTCKNLHYVSNTKIIDCDCTSFQTVTVEIELDCALISNIITLLKEIQHKINDALLSILGIEMNAIHIHLASIKIENTYCKNEKAVQMTP